VGKPWHIGEKESFDWCGWTFDASQNKNTCGCVIEHIRHNGYSFASKVLVWRIWLKTKRNEKEKPYILGGKELSVIGSGEIEESVKANDEVTEVIRPFIPVRTLTMKYVSEEGFFEEEPEQVLTITQTFVFTSYGKDPTHEPSGAVEAARFYPLLQFTFSHPRRLIGPLYFRADYQLQLSIGLGLGQVVAPIFESIGRGEARPQFSDLPMKDEGVGGGSWNPGINQAGIFADRDNPFINIGTIFFLAEKPLQREVRGYGYVHGVPLRGHARNPNQICWDNIHQWGASTKALPTTPGAAHAAHCHWRWTPVAVAGSPIMQDLGAISPRSYFGGSGVAGAPLIDKAVKNQTLRFAITAPANTRNFEKKYEDKENNDPFLQLPKGQDGKEITPENVEKGAILTTWFAIEAFSERALKQNWGGWLFTHGLYFAHGIEFLGTGKEAVGGLRASANKPEGQFTKWDRPEKSP
jgi:hypothetical protein